MSFSKTKNVNQNLFLSFGVGLFVAMIISFGLIILFAFSMKWFSLSENLISPVNMAIKAVSVLFGSLVAVRGETSGLVKGATFGLVYILAAFLCFSFLAKTFELTIGFFLDIICAVLVGGIVGIIKVNRR